MLMISESRIEVSPWTSATVISGSPLEESGRESSVVVQNSLIWNEHGEMRGVVETSSFPSLGGSVSVLIVGCSFDSSQILGNDGIGLSLTRTARRNMESVGRMSSSLIGCWFVNMSSIRCSHPPRLRHLSQKMLGCVVSLTSSHLSGSTIRDVNTVGCVLCSNSSFSSLLSSPNADPDTNEEPSIILPDGTTPAFVDGTEFYFDETSGTESTATSFSHCHFTGANYPPSARPLTFNQSLCTISIFSCSFESIVSTKTNGGAILIFSTSTPTTNTVKVLSCNFTDCSASHYGGGLSFSSTAVITVTGCRCVGWSLTDTSGAQSGGGMFISLSPTPGSTVSELYFERCTSTYSAGGLSIGLVERTYLVKYLSFKECSLTSPTSTTNGGGMTLSSPLSEGDQLFASNLNFEDCSAGGQGGGLSVVSFSGSISLSECEFIRCKVTNPEASTAMGGGLSATASRSTLTLTGCQFVDCSSTALGGALIGMVGGFVMSECLVKNCHSASTGAVCIIPMSDLPITLNDILFIGNTVSDTPTYFDQHESMKGSVQFVDILIEDMLNKNPTDVTITACWTTTTPNSVGMYKTTDAGKTYQEYFRTDHDAFHKMGPYLTQKVEAIVDVDSWRIDLIVKGKIPLESQIYEMKLNETEGNTELTGELKFVNGVGSLLPSSNLNLKFSMAYTITSIVGLVPSSSYSTMTNDISITAEAWAFNLGATPDYLTFATPNEPDTIVVACGGSDSIAECGGDDMPCRTVWAGQMCGKGKGGEWMNVSVRGEAEMGEGFWILGKVGMLLSSESSTQRSRVVIGRSSFSSNDGIVSISSATVQVRNVNVIVPSSGERSSSGWVFVVDSEGDLEMSSIGMIGEGEIGVGLAKVKSGIGRFTSVSMSSGSFGSGVGMIVGEGKWNSISMLICAFVVRDTTTSNAPLISFSSLSPESSFSMEGSRFQKTHRMIGSSSSLSDGDGVIEVLTAQSRTSISDSVFESSGVTDGTGTITRSALLITLNSSSASSHSLVISSCLFLDSRPSSSLSGSLHIRIVSGHTTIVFQDSWFESTTPTRLWTSYSSGIACLDWTRRRVGSSSSDLNGALMEYWDGLPILVRRRGVFSNSKLVMSKKS
ncbi:hypothetical protein BLNAU_2099 [Blattamonas nauphoetae]|uniref:Uncharacterized protein n=1 Tax=Blattamonas nauphoetae TaxID=2049346 RepID=A0ABQ9YH42_9EUKA|nr:hypothetical protein BLNAU_2099 [Blattamonas nauphoetae]